MKTTKTEIARVNYPQVQKNNALKLALLAKRNRKEKQTARLTIADMLAQGKEVDAEIVDNSIQEVQEAIAEIDATIASVEPTTPQPREYIRKLRFLSGIHNAIAPKLNALRQARLETYFGRDEKFMLASQHENFVSLMVDTAHM